MNSLAMSATSDSTPRQAFSALAREHHRMALLYARTLAEEEHTARDLSQDAFLLAWQNWARFDVTRDFGSWLRGIIRNKWREHCRKNSRLSSWDDEALSQLEDTIKELPESGFFDQLKDCLDQLPETLLGPILAHYYQDLSTAEAADQLNTSEAATRKRLQRGRAALKSCLTTKTSHA
ncbi:sigma-70 family RNA polymerase sigma factor [Akkermansiaceae bacterium]|nr:sigma-70 family RNA polymerase sigma factor [Akkermansiaceae bacterium]MDB4421759.1 sigma-70 family RNA polymerase sigma factor [Akkermansiaceae bacterium]MDB4457786.1 sigma-70 family RNA polymerase sigma factor [Akkermansiaceae bacterium]MDB4578511.1 sigma-70 family RNA polymerase sigma factor [Akkermansiaceae bacterium]